VVQPNALPAKTRFFSLHLLSLFFVRPGRAFQFCFNFFILNHSFNIFRLFNALILKINLKINIILNKKILVKATLTIKTPIFFHFISF